MELKAKVAQQIHRALTRNSRSGSDFDGAADAAVAVVLKRMREPSAAMWMAGDELSYAQQWRLTPHQIQSLWRVMIKQFTKENM